MPSPSVQNAELVCGFYTVGIKRNEVNANSLPNNVTKLKADIVAAFQKHKLHMLCLSELGELGSSLRSKLTDKSVKAWLKDLLSDPAVWPVRVYSASYLPTIVRSDGDAWVRQYKLVRSSQRTAGLSASPYAHSRS